jgi:DNA polymerase delta subunit 1
VRLSCLGCKAALTGEDTGKSLCSHCQPREAEIYIRNLNTVGALEEQFGALWTQCQRCQGSLHMDVLCTSRCGCPTRHRLLSDCC